MIGVLLIFGILLMIALIFLSKMLYRSLSTKIDASLKEQFVSFQLEINKELLAARNEITNSKDIITQNTIKAIETIKDIGSIISKITQQQEEVQKLGQSLKDILQVPKLRGNYGEIVLEEMLEKVLPKGVWEKQYSIDGREKVDAVIKLKDVIIPIDAKFPREDYNKYLDASSPEEKEKYWKSFENAVKKQIKDIKEKYLKPEKGTSEFALMFIPSEAIYYETIAEENYLGHPSEIYKCALENNVFPVSPNTFYAFLQVILIAVRNVEIIKNVKRLQEGLKTLQKSFESFCRKFEEIGEKIDKAQNAYKLGKSHIDSYKGNLDSILQLREFREDESVLS